jgi:cell division protein FtsN
MNETLTKRLLGACALVGVTLILANLLPEPQAVPPSEPAAKRLTYDLRPTPPEMLQAPDGPTADPLPAPAVAVAEATPSVILEHKPEIAAPVPPKAEVVAPKPKPKPKAKPQPAPPPTAEITPASEPEVVVAKAEAPVAAAETPAAGPAWFVQIGAFAKQTNAQQSMARLQKAGLRARQDTLEWKSGTRYRVRCGPFASREEAEAERVRATKLGFGDARLAHEPAG